MKKGFPPVPAGYRERMPPCEEAATLHAVGRDNFGQKAYLAPPPASAWRRISAAAAKDGVPLVLISAFRSIGRQRQIVAKKIEAGLPLEEISRVIAYPGFSEHHTGWAIDLAAPNEEPLAAVFDRTAQFRWLRRHAGRFGFLSDLSGFLTLED